MRNEIEIYRGDIESFGAIMANVGRFTHVRAVDSLLTYVGGLADEAGVMVPDSLKPDKSIAEVAQEALEHIAAFREMAFPHFLELVGDHVDTVEKMDVGYMTPPTSSEPEVFDYH